MRRLAGTPPRLDPGRISALVHGLIVVGLIVVLRIAGREILEALVIAALLAFILSPLIRRLRQVGGVAHHQLFWPFCLRWAFWVLLARLLPFRSQALRSVTRAIP